MLLSAYLCRINNQINIYQMKKYIITSIILLLSFTAGAQDIEAALTEKIQTLDRTYDKPSLQTLANDFRRIALADANSWLANYYAAYTNVRLAERSEGSTIDSFCDEAEKYLKLAEKQPTADPSEIATLYAYLYSSKVRVNPMMRGSKYGRTSGQYLQKAIQLNPDNPRPYIVRAVGIYHTPKVFGGGAEKAKPVLTQAFEKFAKFTPKTPNSPHWGKSMADYLQKEIQKK